MDELHVKYRPTDFSEVLGQDAIIKSLKHVVKDGRAKTFLFTGPSGVGKTTLARILANSFAGGQATQANIHEVNAALTSGIDAIRDVVEHTRTRAIGASPIKVVILDEVHRLSGNAWDVLLKPTEEPPAHVYWMMCSTAPGKIPKTILTRALRYDLKPVDEDDLLALLVDIVDKEKITVADEVIETIAEEAGGSPRQALVYLESCVYCETAAEARRVMRSAAKSREVIDLCRFLMRPQGRLWPEAVKLVKAFDGTMDNEGIRIVVVNYLSTALMDAKGTGKAAELLCMLDAFSRPYNITDKNAPLLLSLGLALGMDRA